MEDHQELRHKKFPSSRVLRNRQKKTLLGESMNHYEELSCYYRLRGNPKKTQKSLHDDRLGTRKRNKKRLIRCQECGKGFRYEKCLSKHGQVMHSLNQKKKVGSEESMRSDLLCSFGDAQRRKRSKRVSTYKKSPPFSVSSSSSSDDGELLAVAESLILLAKSGEAPVLNPEMNLRELESEDGFFGNEEKLEGIGTESDGTSKLLWGFLRANKAMKDNDSDQQKQVGVGVGVGGFRTDVGLERVSFEDRPGPMSQNAETGIEQKLGSQETATGDSNSASKGSQMNTEHQCRLCGRVFSTYQALGGHQTLHRTRRTILKSQNKRCREESVEAEAYRMAK